MRPGSLAAESIKLHALSIHYCIAIIARIAQDQTRGRAACDIRPHQGQQCASVLELCSYRRLQAGVPVAHLLGESIHRVEDRQSEP